MSALVDVVNQLVSYPMDTLGKIKKLSNSDVFDTLGKQSGAGGNNTPVDILETPKEYVFYMDFPGLSKSDIRVTVEDKNILMIQSNGKRKREEGEEEAGCKYMVLERRPPKKLTRKFRLPEDANLSAITAKCENGVLTVVVEKLPPPPKPKTKTVDITIS